MAEITFKITAEGLTAALNSISDEQNTIRNEQHGLRIEQDKLIEAVTLLRSELTSSIDKLYERVDQALNVLEAHPSTFSAANSAAPSTTPIRDHVNVGVSHSLFPPQKIQAETRTNASPPARHQNSVDVEQGTAMKATFPPSTIRVPSPPISQLAPSIRLAEKTSLKRHRNSSKTTDADSSVSSPREEDVVLPKRVHLTVPNPDTTETAAPASYDSETSDRDISPSYPGSAAGDDGSPMARYNDLRERFGLGGTSHRASVQSDLERLGRQGSVSVPSDLVSKDLTSTNMYDRLHESLEQRVKTGLQHDNANAQWSDQTTTNFLKKPGGQQKPARITRKVDPVAAPTYGATTTSTNYMATGRPKRRAQRALYFGMIVTPSEKELNEIGAYTEEEKERFRNSERKRSGPVRTQCSPIPSRDEPDFLTSWIARENQETEQPLGSQLSESQNQHLHQQSSQSLLTPTVPLPTQQALQHRASTSAPEATMVRSGRPVSMEEVLDDM